MKTKTIKKVIVKKLNEWLETIPDGNLRNEIRANILVSGGSIASMFLRENINDFDIYIQDIDVLVKLARHYCGDKVLDGRKREALLQERYPDWSENDDEFAGSGEKYAAEEFIRIKNLKPDQVKLDIASIGERKEINEDDKYKPVFLSQNAISLSDDIQIVLRFSGTPEEIHKNFDFIHAANYFTFDDGLVTNIEALESLLTKNLKYQGSLYPLTSILRMKKFLQRGWQINAGEVLKIMFQISQLDLTDIEVLEEQLIGVDVAYFSILLDVLRGVNKEKMTPSYINECIDRVFNTYEEEDIEEKQQTDDTPF